MKLHPFQGASHLPLFVYKATFNGLVGTGQGNSKKRAKHAAAQELYDLVIANDQKIEEPNSEMKTVVQIFNKVSMRPVTVHVPGDGSDVFNPIGKLQELCITKNWPHAMYDTPSEDGPPHQRKFTVSCRVGNLVHNGNASKKKDAKHIAAQKMLEELLSLPQLSAVSLNNCFDNYEDGKESDSQPLFMIKEADNENLDEEEINSLGLEMFKFAMQILDDIVIKNNLVLSHFEIKNKSFSAAVASHETVQPRDLLKSACRFQHLIELNTTPDAVLFGSGETREKAKQSVNMSNPISALLEHCARKGFAEPDYEIASVSGASHLPLFVYKATFNGLVGTGQGNSKKRAKHAAAQELYDLVIENDQKIEERNPEVNTVQIFSKVSMRPVTVHVPGDGSDVFNPIGQLNELCVTKNWPNAIYDTPSEDGPPHQRKFTVSCRVGNLVHNGNASKKKDAKHIAAQKMLEEFQSLPQLNAPLFMIKGADNENLDEEEINSLGLEMFKFAIQILDNIVIKNNLVLSHFEIKNKSFSGRFQHLIELNTTPDAVLFGSGETREKAKQCAAVDALNYIQNMTDIELSIESYISSLKEKI
ncbi:Interferon-inducible double-stranded RNA-dependent protein kinase activator A A [Nymphon striatum]|nr:Interferon-inducible double-stranded RNA-dependent protein kinase activator A A [Nymphon striatum]